jgi:CBS domain-containing protein
MAMHVVGTSAPAEVRVESVGPFEGRCQIIGRGPPDAANADDAMIRAEIHCRGGAAPVSGAACLHCSRFRGMRNLPGNDVLVQCSWSHLDPVWARMSTGVLAVVAPETKTEAALQIAMIRRVRHLMVVRDHHLVGVLCVCDLIGPDGAGHTAGERMCTETFVIHASSTLADAASALHALHIGCLPVTDHGILVGVLTRGDLLRAGIPKSVVGESRCKARA